MDDSKIREMNYVDQTIRMITFKSAPDRHYQVGKNGVTAIEQLKSLYQVSGDCVYLVYVKTREGKTRVWKKIENCPVMVEYETNENPKR